MHFFIFFLLVKVEGYRVTKCFFDLLFSEAIEKYFNNLTNMKPLEEPNYNALRQYMREGITKLGDVSTKLEFSMAKSRPKPNTLVSPVSPRGRKPVLMKNTQRRVKSGTSKVVKNNRRKKVVSSDEEEEPEEDNDEDENDDDDDNEEDEDEGEDDFIESTPERKSPAKRSWKDCPSVVSCAELLLKDDRTLRRSKRNKLNDCREISLPLKKKK